MTPVLHVVGIGASAGGLDALRAMVAHLPRTGRLVYVVAQHMAAGGHAELMVTLLGREASLEVLLAGDGTALEPDRILVLPAGMDGVVRGLQVRLQPSAVDSLSRPSVNVLLESIAHEHGTRGVGIILSGAGSDGVLGCRAVRKHGGLVLAQAPETARFSGMPDAAVRAGVVAETLPPALLGERLGRLFPDVQVHLPAPPPPEPGLPRLLQRVCESTGIDFSGYKEETLRRRLAGRLDRLGLESLEGYEAYLAAHGGELEALAQHFLVSKSSFFRDCSSFAAVEKSLGARVRGRPRGEPLRIWVPGCASGEECYTLAIVVAEAMGGTPAAGSVAIQGSDLNPRALEQAESGWYPGTVLEEMAPELRSRHFLPAGEGFRVRDSIRSMCCFTRQDVLQGALPRDLDMISCRNLLIYLKGDCQARLLHRFHAALRPDGLFFLGLSETVGIAGQALFRIVDAEHRLYQRRG